MKEQMLLQSVSNALELLEVLGQKKEYGVSELAAKMGLGKSTIHRLLTTLEAHGFAAQNTETGRYGLGLQAIAVARQALDLLDIRPLVRQILVNLRDNTGETVHLTIRQKESALFIDKVHSSNAMSMNSLVGWEAPLYCTGTGKLILSHLSDSEKECIINKMPLTRYTTNTITDKSKLLEELDRIKKQGWSCDNEEIEIGLYCIAAPVFDRNGEFAAAISISGPVTRMKGKPELIKTVQEAAEQASQKLGFFKDKY